MRPALLILATTRLSTGWVAVFWHAYRLFLKPLERGKVFDSLLPRIPDWTIILCRTISG